jgi:hypothetical protein
MTAVSEDVKPSRTEMLKVLNAALGCLNDDSSSSESDSDSESDDDEATKYVPEWTQILNDFYGGEKLLDAVQIAEAVICSDSELFDGERLLLEEDNRYLPASIIWDILRKASESEVRNYLSDKIPSGNGTWSAVVAGSNVWLEGIFRDLGGLKKIKGALPDHHNQHKIQETPEHCSLLIEDIVKLLFPASE